MHGGGLVVAGGLPLEDRREQQISLLDAVASFALDQALRPAQPAGARPDLPTGHEVHADPARTPRGTQAVARRQIQLVGALQSNEVVLSAEHVRRRREQLEVYGPEGLRAIRP